MTPALWHFDAQDNQLGQISELQTFAKDFEVNGSRTLDVKTREHVSKGDRLVYRDETGKWDEFIVLDVPEADDGTGADIQATDATAELGWDYIEDRRPTGTPSELVAAVLEAGGSRWESLGSNIEAEPVRKIFYHTNALKALNRIAADYDGEIRKEIVVEGGRVTHRRVGVFKREGEDRGRRFEYGASLLGVTRRQGTEPVYTRVYGWGRGVAVIGEDDEITGYGRRLSFADVNGGKAYVESAEALEKYGRPDGKGGKAHVSCDVVFEDETDAQALLAKTREWAEDQYEPAWSYEASVFWLAKGGLDVEAVGEGDVVAVIDPEFTPEVRDKSRITSGHVDYLKNEKTRYQIGHVQSVVSATIADQQQTVGEITEKTPGWDGTKETVEEIPETWLRQQMRRLNEEFNAAGQCYKFTSLEKGDIWANGPLTAEGKPEGATDHAINLCGLGFRIASAVKDGDFDWTTFGTGDGFTASLINVGKLVCGDNFLDLDSGEMRIATTAKIGQGNASVTDYVQSVSSAAANTAVNNVVQYYVPISNFDAYLNMRNTFNALTNNGKDKGLFIQDGKVFLNGDYIRTGVIESTDGLSFWDLNTGYFETTSTIFHDMHSRIDNGMFAIKMDETDIITMAAYTKPDNPNYHPAAIQVFTDLVLAAPSNVGVSYDATTYGTLTYEPTMRNGTVTVVDGVSMSGEGTLSVSRRSLRFGHGMLLSTNSIANQTFSVPTIPNMTLVESAEPAEEAVEGLALAIRRVDSEEQLMAAADARHMVWQADPETSALGIPIYTGDEWTLGVPEADPAGEAADVSIPTTERLDAEVAAIHAEIDAIGDAVAKASPAAAISLKTRIAALRTKEEIA